MLSPHNPFNVFSSVAPQPFSRRTFLAAAGLTALSNLKSQSLGGSEISVWQAGDVQEKARDLASRPFVAAPKLPAALQALDYDTYRLIAFEHERALWKGTRSPFWLECFHRGYLFAEKVELNLIEHGDVSPLRFERDLFQYRGDISDLRVPDDIGFAGVRFLGKFSDSKHFLEIASFVGASYFRAIGAGQVYGTSARGLAIDAGLPKQEEFPAFREFWIEQPDEAASNIRFWALLDSPSVTGAYEFKLQPGVATTCDVRAKLFFRTAPHKLCLAPLTSMWMWGSGRPAPQHDRRPHVHDADGLMVHTSAGEWIWRPLAQQSYPSLTHYDFAGVRGFGLLQRARDPKQYLDDEAKYHLRPSVWIEPQKGWERGAVELLELPAEHEGIDNIAAWWVPRQKIHAGETLELAYRISFMALEPQHALAKVTSTQLTKHNSRKCEIEIQFQGENLASISSDVKLLPAIRSDRGDVKEVRCDRPAKDTCRLRFVVHFYGNEAVELQAGLFLDDTRISETWRYLCPT